MAKRAFGELEGEILHILESGARKTVKDVHQALEGDNNYNTIMTVMSRLAEKKLLAREKMGIHYEYWILPASSSPSLLNKIKKKFMGVRTGLLVSHLLKTAEDLSPEDLDEMEELIRKAKAAKKGSL